MIDGLTGIFLRIVPNNEQALTGWSLFIIIPKEGNIGSKTT